MGGSQAPREQAPQDQAPRDHAPRDQAPAEFWEERYAGQPRMWSGRVNTALAAVTADRAPGRALDLGCGEGGDVLWLAERGWTATGLDLAPSAIARAREEAATRGIGGAEFAVADLGAWADTAAGNHAGGDGQGDGGYDLVSASFLQSPVALERAKILRAGAARVRPGGLLVVIAHAAPPSWVRAADPAPTHTPAPAPTPAAGPASAHTPAPDGSVSHGPTGQHGPGDFPSPTDELTTLALAPEGWRILRAEVRERPVSGPDGERGTIGDTVVVAERLTA